MQFLLLIVGIGVLLKGADWLVDGASSIAKRFHVSEIMIGLTIVAFGTSAPELAVNAVAAIQGKADITFGNILGSNISNTFLILGIAALIYPLSIRRNTVWKEIPLSLLAGVVIFMLADDMLFSSATQGVVTRGDGIVLLSFFVIFLYYTFGMERIEGPPAEREVKIYGTLLSWGMILGGLVGVVVGGKLTVYSAIVLARAFGFSEAFIGLTVVAIGTSLPELASTAVAAYKKKADIAVGNIVGSNIFNIFFILGTTAVIAPIPFPFMLRLDVLLTILSSVVLFAMIFVGKRMVLHRWEGGVLLGSYALYIAFLVMRG